MSRLCATVLAFEAIVIMLAIPVAITIEHSPKSEAGGIGAFLIVSAIVLAAAFGRLSRAGSAAPGRWPLVAGSLLQVLIIAFGAVVPVMYALGAIFAGLWGTGIWLGYRAQRAAAR